MTVDYLDRIEGCPNGSPVVGQNYILSRGDTGDHPEAHWGLHATLRVAKDLANRIFEEYGETLSFNDFSLPMGGLHELHDGHREGKNFDINKDGYDCNSTDDGFLEISFTDAFGENRLVEGEGGSSKNFPNLHCYLPTNDNPNGLHVNAVN